MENKKTTKLTVEKLKEFAASYLNPSKEEIEKMEEENNKMLKERIRRMTGIEFDD